MPAAGGHFFWRFCQWQGVKKAEILCRPAIAAFRDVGLDFKKIIKYQWLIDLFGGWHSGCFGECNCKKVAE